MLIVWWWWSSRWVVPDSCGPMDCGLPAYCVHGILKARILDWVVISFSRGSSQPRNGSQVSCTVDRLFTNWATREVINSWVVVLIVDWSSLVAQTVKHLPTMQETQVQSWGQEDLLEKEVATHSSILAWKIPLMEEPGRLYSLWGCKESDMTERLPFHSSFFNSRLKKVQVQLKKEQVN